MRLLYGISLDLLAIRHRNLPEHRTGPAILALILDLACLHDGDLSEIALTDNIGDGIPENSK